MPWSMKYKTKRPEGPAVTRASCRITAGPSGLADFGIALHGLTAAAIQCRPFGPIFQRCLKSFLFLRLRPASLRKDLDPKQTKNPRHQGGCSKRPAKRDD